MNIYIFIYVSGLLCAEKTSSTAHDVGSVKGRLEIQILSYICIVTHFYSIVTHSIHYIRSVKFFLYEMYREGRNLVGLHILFGQV